LGAAVAALAPEDVVAGPAVERVVAGIVEVGEEGLVPLVVLGRRQRRGRGAVRRMSASGAGPPDLVTKAMVIATASAAD
jgi:hypothetical protein